MELVLPTSFAEQIFDRCKRVAVVRDVHPREVVHLAGGNRLHDAAVLAEEGRPVSRSGGLDISDTSAYDVMAGVVSLDDRARPSLWHEAVVLDDGDEPR